jgi:hypothetical protein
VGALAYGKVGQSTGDLGHVHPVPGARPRAAGRPQDSGPDTDSCWRKLLYGRGRVEVRDDQQVVPVDTARYVWSSNSRLANGSVPGLNGDDSEEASSLRTNPGRALYGQHFKGTIKSVCDIQGEQGWRNTQAKVRIHRPAAAAAARGPTTNIALDNISPCDREFFSRGLNQAL